jgi:ribose-phosphate pyrophosphokinase
VSDLVQLGLYQVAILLDDMIDTGTTLALAARTLEENGARSVHALISHGMSVSTLLALADHDCSHRAPVRS